MSKFAKIFHLYTEHTNAKEHYFNKNTIQSLWKLDCKDLIQQANNFITKCTFAQTI